MEAFNRFQSAIDLFDAIHALDPNVETLDGQPFPAAVLYARRMTQWLAKLEPNASETLRLAAYSQHLKRWEIPRSTYPMDRAGYHRWRTALAGFHADEAGRVLRKARYDNATISRVQSLVRKERLKADPEVQLLEDVACLVFLEFYFAEFSERHDDQKLIGILRRTWKKMSPRGHAAATKLEFPPGKRALVEKALGDETSGEGQVFPPSPFGRGTG